MSNKSRVWKTSFGTSGTRTKPYIAKSPGVDPVFQNRASFHPSKKVISEEEVDFTKIDNRNRHDEINRKRAAALLQNSVSSNASDLELDSALGGIKTASVGGADVTSGGTSDTISSSTADFYSPWLSSDYLELPRSYAEERRWYRHFYDQDPWVGRAIDLKTYIPLSKMTLGIPRCSSHKTAQQVLAYYERMWAILKMSEKNQMLLHEYNLIGEALVYFEWDEEEKIWSKAYLLDPDICEVRHLPFQDETQVFLTPDNSIREVISQMMSDDETSEFAMTLQELSDEASMESEMTAIQLNTDPSEGSFVRYFSRKRSPYRPGPGVSVLRRLLRTLLFRDKIRQALTQVTSRHMTPIRVVSGEGLGPEDVDDLRLQIDMALAGPDFSIITNTPIEWNEYTAEGRLFDATAVMEQTLEEILAGLGVTKELLLGEGSYGGGRITLQVLDTEFTLVREMLTSLWGDLAKVAAEKNGFIEKDEETGVEYLIYAPLKFARMALRDYADQFDFMYNMYANGALDRDTMLEYLNIDPADVEAKLKKNFLTINDNLADEFRRTLLTAAADKILTDTNVTDRLIAGFGLEYNEDASSEDEAEDDFGLMDEAGPTETGVDEEGYSEDEAVAEVEEDFESTGDFQSSDVVDTVE